MLKQLVDSVLDVMARALGKMSKVGCDQHKTKLTATITKFNLITRLHFYVKEQNKQREQRRKKQKLVKQGKLL